MLKITVFFNDKEIRTLETDKDIVNIGRWEASEIHLENVGVSKIHAKIKRQADGYLLEDCNSTNGTFVNGERITAIPLTGGTTINISKYRLVCDVRGGGQTGQFAAPDIPPTVKV